MSGAFDNCALPGGFSAQVLDGKVAWQGSFPSWQNKHRAPIPQIDTDSLTSDSSSVGSSSRSSSSDAPMEAHATCPSGHSLQALGISHDNGWDCNASRQPEGCKS